MRTADFDFDLPEDRIALRPAERRDASRLLHVRGGGFGDRRFAELPEILRPGDLLVLNDTKVLPAALRGIRPARPEGGGGDVAVEANLLAPVGEGVWRALARPGKRLRDGDRIDFGAGLSGTVLSRDGGEVSLRLDAEGDLDAALRAAGHMPLPPYIARRRPADDEDRERYQTVFAQAEGSVAAPTAGLHFTPEVLATCEARGIGAVHVTLHVGAGTFLPVSAEETSDHKMHAEWGHVSEEAAAAMREAKARGGRIVCVGTTALRLTETAAASGEVRAFLGETDIFITPGYDFRACDVLLTNFHLPRSTLFMLVCAFSGTDTMKAAYAHAVEAGYRFYSYGDACLLERE
ncbi:tRNA preQ1(34) S-adenosylmethionine ribosyltransferase-isomerase QueA [Parvularcula dongshanensis]|uniref:S-adenosylmethionine:tRNA ribosyltransferase-isomerase n=1 Tax=Parvularcula dongshanensis TaxID=1173995 RepID=A0A840I3C5_9PROT|nr:tRNA preQ1(34) S-adenosylmethionine ribosyltransferase-isomerase QueA [Parvularcula dongshanensis]MBB4659277.1 S-adenosylmethionine:tRNA ribosyltransferase-isomerase [Parvularcula dongshanensis]